MYNIVQFKLCECENNMLNNGDMLLWSARYVVELHKPSLRDGVKR